MSLRRTAPGLLVAAATVALFAVSRGKWSDPLIDSGREWIVPDALSRGELLYRDVAYWFGPFTPYLHAAFFAVFGSSFTTLVAAGCVGGAAALFALFAAIRRVADSRQALAWTALAIPALVFMPNAGGAILGMGYRIWHAAVFALLAITVAAGGGRRAARIGGAGALAALAGLCRTEWGLAALSAAALVLALRPGGAGDRKPSRAAELLGLLAGFALVFGGVWILFVALAGPKAVADQPIFLLNIPEATRGHVGLAGLRAWRTGIWNLLYSGCMWLAAALGVAVVALRKEGLGPNRRRLYALGAALALAALCAAMGAVPGPVLFSAAPLACLAALVLGWRGARTPGAADSARTGTVSSVALAGFGWMGLLASHRRVFFLGDAPYVAPPLLFAFVCGAGLLARAAARESSPSARLRLAGAFAAAVGVLALGALAGRIAGYASEERVAIRGTGGMLSARPELAREIEETAAAVRGGTPAGAGLVVIPEGEVLNFLSGRANPARQKLYLPGYLTDANGSSVIADLERTRPGAVVYWLRPTGEYERGLFGTDYGKDVAAWIDAHYAPAAAASTTVPGARARAHSPFTLLLPRR